MKRGIFGVCVVASLVDSICISSFSWCGAVVVMVVTGRRVLFSPLLLLLCLFVVTFHACLSVFSLLPFKSLYTAAAAAA
jgi:hypothetical protein